MRATIDVEADRSEDIARVLSPSLTTDERVRHKVEADGEDLRIEVETDALGTLRGTTDTALKLAMLSKKILR